MPYADEFFINRRGTALESARVIVPWVVEVVRPASVIDVGCGTGTWLAEFLRCGVPEGLGVDGDWVPRDRLEIPPERFRAWDLAERFPADRPFDLVVSLEVAEHLPADRADEFARTLCALGPVLFFSAAVPQQGGVGHVNEQWPGYWIGRFDKLGYQCVDCVRGRFWDDDRVAPWYCQNAFFFVAREALPRYGALLAHEREHSMGGRPLVHPRQYLQKIELLSDPMHWSVRKLAGVAPARFSRAVLRRLWPGKAGR